VDVRALRDEPFVLPARHGMPGLHQRVLETCAQAGFAPRAVQKDVWLMQTILGLVAAGIGVALVLESVEDLQRTGVAYRRTREPSAPVELALAWRRNDRTPVVERFVECAVSPPPERPARAGTG
jgi:DNA-binding transcriptional LysR family regulator